MATRSPTEHHAYWGPFALAADLPNVAGATVQSASLEAGDQAYVSGEQALYVCIVPTLGAAVWSFVGPFSSGLAVYGSFSDTTSQPIPGPGNEVAVSYNTIDPTPQGVSVVAGTKLTVSVSGVYALSISPQIYHSGGTAEVVTFWARLNNNDVPNSTSRFEVGNNNNTVLPYLEIVLPLNAGDYVEWIFTATAGTSISLQPFPATTDYPANPSVIASVKRLGAKV